MKSILIGEVAIAGSGLMKGELLY